MGKRHAPKAKAQERLSDFGIDGMIYMQENGRKAVHLSSFMMRPAYAYTKAEQRTIRKSSICEPCGYYGESEIDHNMECQYPWDDPQDYDLAVQEYLPCKEADYEKD